MSNTSLGIFALFLVDVIAIGLVGYGFYLIYPPAAFIAVGGLLWYEANVNVAQSSTDSRS